MMQELNEELGRYKRRDGNLCGSECECSACVV